MAAGSRREKRVKKRNEDQRHTGEVRKAKNNKFDTQNEGDDISRELGNRKRFSIHDLKNVKPLNERQEDFMEAYYSDVPMILATGVPGSSKTFLGMFCSLADVFDSSTPYDKIVIVRSGAPTRNVGFLPGSLEDKQGVYELPYQDTCYELMPKYKSAYAHLKALGYLEFHLTSHLRGLTWDNTIVIFDEFQSATFHEVNTVITRLGDNSRIILAGDINQNDLTKKNDQTGFHRIVESLDRMPSDSVAHIHYEPEDCVRSGLVKDWLLATY